MIDDGVKGAGKEEDEVRVADISMHVLEALETGEAAAEARRREELATPVRFRWDSGADAHQEPGPAEADASDLAGAVATLVTNEPVEALAEPEPEPDPQPEPEPDPQPEPEPVLQADVGSDAAAPAEPSVSFAVVPAVGGPDDLSQVRSMSPADEEALNRLGITTFAQLAALDGDAVRELEEVLGLPNRISHFNWVGQARALARDKDA